MEKMEENKVKIEKYTDKNDKTWIRIKFTDSAKTEVIMLESEFEKQYGKIEQYVA